MNTGIYRRIDSLGRVVLPKEVRQQLHLDEGDMVEISVADDKVILTPYTHLSNTAFLIEMGLLALERSDKLEAVITDKNRIFFSKLPEFPKNTVLSAGMLNLLLVRKDYTAGGTKPVRLTDSSGKIVTAMFPIKKYGELYGSLVFLRDTNMAPEEPLLAKGRLFADIIGTVVGEWE